MRIVAPDNMIAIGDDTNGTTNSASSYGLIKLSGWGLFKGIYWSQDPVDLSQPDTVGTVHNQGVNMVFLDGHLEWAKWWKWVEYSDNAARRWNYDNKPHGEVWYHLQNNP